MLPSCLIFFLMSQPHSLHAHYCFKFEAQKRPEQNKNTKLLRKHRQRALQMHIVPHTSSGSYMITEINYFSRLYNVFQENPA